MTDHVRLGALKCATIKAALYISIGIKRPPIGETRIKHYDGKMVTYAFYDHHDKTIKEQTMSAIDTN